MKDALLAEYDHEMGVTRKLLARLVDEKLSWRPHDRSMSLGGLATHLANLPSWGDYILNQTFFDLADAPPRLEERRSRAEVLEMFDGTATRTRTALDKTDAELVAPWTLKRVGQELFTMPRASGPVLISAETGSNVKHWVGVGMIAAGVANAAFGALYYSEASSLASSSSNTAGNTKSFYQGVGIATIVIGVVLAGIGIPLAMSSTSVEVR